MKGLAKAGEEERKRWAVSEVIPKAAEGKALVSPHK